MNKLAANIWLVVFWFFEVFIWWSKVGLVVPFIFLLQGRKIDYSFWSKLSCNYIIYGLAEFCFENSHLAYMLL